MRRLTVTVAGTVCATAALVFLLADRRDEFEQAVRAAPVSVLAVATLLQLAAQLLRTEAWHLSVEAAGATFGRRRLFQAAGIGSLASQLNAQAGTAARIAILRRSDPDECPRVPALIAAEVPIMAVEGVLAALACFTLVGPLDLAWWVPIAVLAVTTGIVVALARAADRRRHGLWSGLAVLSSLDGRNRIVALMLLAIFSQIARNWIVLRALGLDASLFDATAVLIAQSVLAQLPLGPSVGAAATVAILGSGGVIVAAAAGVLLTATGTVGGLVFLAWGALDRLARRSARRRQAIAGVSGSRASAASMSASENSGSSSVPAR